MLNITENLKTYDEQINAIKAKLGKLFNFL